MNKVNPKNSKAKFGLFPDEIPAYEKSLREARREAAEDKLLMAWYQKEILLKLAPQIAEILGR